MSCRNTPTTLQLAGIALLIAAGATVFFVPDDSAALVAAQTAAAVALAGVAGTAPLQFLRIVIFVTRKTDLTNLELFYVNRT